MKGITSKIQQLLANEQHHEHLRNIAAANSPQMVAEIRMGEAFEKYDGFRSLLLEAIEDGGLDKLPYQRRAAIHSSINSIITHRNNVNQIVTHIEALHDNLNQSGLFSRDLGKVDYETELRELAKLKTRLSKYINQFDENRKKLDYIIKKETEVNNLVDNLKDEEVNIARIKENISNSKSEIEGIDQDAKTLLEDIKETNKSVNDTKLSIATFSENIDEYKDSIAKLEDKAKAIIANEKKINDLIDQAEKALQLKSAEGISAAFSAQYETASDSKQRNFWLILSGSFVVIAVCLTVWVVGGWGIQNPDSINSILGRIFGVGIAITGAAFCARQYVKQKEIAEDYAYKVVLSKSILAFSEEIDLAADDNGGEVSKYLQKVLDEIHKDPLRTRKDSNRSRKFSKDSISTLKELTEVLNNIKS